MTTSCGSKGPAFASERALCASFIGMIGADWTAYAETGGWDIVLVRRADGFQIGIQAKLKLNLQVLGQAIEEYGSIGVTSAGPDCRAVMVPEGQASPVGIICDYIGVTIIRVSHPGSHHRLAGGFAPALPAINPERYWRDDWHEWCPHKRVDLPEYVPDVAAGASAPLQLTSWKIGALKIAIILEQRGIVTRADFKVIGIDHRRWTARESGWLLPDRGGYARGPALPDFKAQHPKVYAEIAADAAKWMPLPSTLFGASSS